MGTNERVRDLIEPLVSERDLELVDVEHGGGTLRVTVDREGGVDIDTLSTVTRDVSRVLDERDPVPGRYTLEVSSPGLERTLRTPTHFRRAVGEKIKVKTVPGTEGERRIAGVLASADDDGVVVTVDGDDGPTERALTYGEIDRARTMFDWGPPPKPGRGSKPGRQKKTKTNPSKKKADR